MYSSLIFYVTLGQFWLVISADIQNCSLPGDANEDKVSVRARVSVCISKCIGLPSFNLSNDVTRETCIYDQNTGKDIPQCSKKLQRDKNSDKVVFCHYELKRVAYDGSYFSPYLNSKDFDPNLCSHVVVLDFADIVNKDNETYTLERKNTDVKDNRSELQFLRAKHNVKLILCAGDLSGTTKGQWSVLVSKPASRATFIASVVKILTENNFDGVEIPWNGPVCWNGCYTGPKADKPNFQIFAEEISAALKPLNLLLTCHVAPLTDQVKVSYDLLKLKKYFDWFLVLACNFHGAWDKTALFVSSLDQTMDTIENMLLLVKDPKKIVLAICTDYTILKLSDTNKTSIGSPIKGAGNKENLNSRVSTAMFYSDICKGVKSNGWTVQRKVSMRIGSYAYMDDQWVSFEDVLNIRQKMKYVQKTNLGGAALYPINGDDFENLCGCGHYPLLRAINEELRGPRCDLPNCV